MTPKITVPVNLRQMTFLRQKSSATHCHSKNYLYICRKSEWTMKETKPTYKKQGNIGFFDSDETMEKLNKMGNQGGTDKERSFWTIVR